jgi:hypothetical protein
MSRNSLRYQTLFSNPLVHSDKVISEEQEGMHLSSNRDLETSLLDVRIKPILMKNKQELTEIPDHLLKPLLALR